MKEVTVFTDYNDQKEELTKEEQAKAKKLFPYGIWKEGETLYIKPQGADREIKLENKEEIDAFIKAVKLASSL